MRGGAEDVRALVRERQGDVQAAQASGQGAVLVLGAPLILAVLGSQYAEGGADSLRLIGLGLPFGVIATLFAVTGFMAKKTWPIFFSQLASTVIFLSGTYFALHRFGIVGAAGAFLLSEVVVGLALAPTTVRRLRELVRSSEEKLADEVAEGEKVLARGVAPVPARGVVTVPRLRPGYDTGPMQVLFLPAAVVDWERLGQIERPRGAVAANAQMTRLFDEPFAFFTAYAP